MRSPSQTSTRLGAGVAGRSRVALQAVRRSVLPHLCITQHMRTDAAVPSRQLHPCVGQHAAALPCDAPFDQVSLDPE